MRGIVVQARSYLSLVPPAQAKAENGVWKVGETPWLSGTFIYLKNQPILVVGGYVRGCMKSPEASDFFSELMALTDRGRIPFILAADFNATPGEVNTSLWATTLRASVYSPGRRTCTAREIDFFLISDVLDTAIIGVEESWANPLATHAMVRLVVSRSSSGFMMQAPRTPVELPHLSPEVSNSSRAHALWAELVGQTHHLQHIGGSPLQAAATAPSRDTCGAVVAAHSATWLRHSPLAEQLKSAAAAASSPIEELSASLVSCRTEPVSGAPSITAAHGASTPR